MAEHPPYESFNLQRDSLILSQREQALRRIIEELFEIAAPGTVKNALWAKYQSLIGASEPQRENDPRAGFSHLPQQVRSHDDYHAWSSWVERTSVDRLLAALHTCETWDTSAGILRDELQQRGYILVGKEPRDITLEKAEG